MGLVYLPTWLFDSYGKSVGKCTSPSDSMANWLTDGSLHNIHAKKYSKRGYSQTLTTLCLREI